MKITIPDTLVVLVVAIFLLSTFVSTGYVSPKLQEGAIYSTSYIEEGSVVDGKIIGGKIHVNAVISKGTESIQILTKDQEIKMGDKIVKPQKTLTLSIKNLGSYALADHKTSSFTYYKPKWGSVLTAQYLTNTGPWSVHNPLQIQTFVGTSETPFSSSKVELFGQSQVSLDDNSDIIIKQIDISFLGPDLPNENVAAMTSIDIPEIPDPNYQPNKLYIFDRLDLITTGQNFYAQYGSDSVDFLRHPDYVLWSGYDKGALTGWGNKDWKGLPKEADFPSSQVTYNTDTGKFIIPDVDFTSNVDIIIDSELVGTILVLKGIGEVSDAKFDIPEMLSEETPELMSVTFKNSGELDTFNIIPNAQHGEVIFTPKNYIGEELKHDETKTFDFLVTSAGSTDTSLTEVHDKISIEIRPSNGDKSTFLTKQIIIQTSELPDSLSTFNARNLTFNSLNPNTGTPNLDPVSWYSNIYFIGGISLIIIALLLYFGIPQSKPSTSRNSRRNLKPTSLSNNSITETFSKYSLLLTIAAGTLLLIAIVYYVSIHPTATVIFLALLIILAIVYFVLRIYLEFKEGALGVVGDIITGAMSGAEQSKQRRKVE